MTIKIEKISNGFACYFPFELKDSFKAIFKSAKWNASARRWEVGSRSGKRLEQWAELAEPAAKEIEDAEEAELNAKELAEIEAEIAKFRIARAKLQQTKSSYENTIEALGAAKTELAEAKKVLQAEIKEVKQRGEEARKLLANVCDMGKIELARETLIKHHGSVGSNAREVFKDAQAIVKDQIDKLASAGFKSSGLNILYWANFNRPDRDRVKITNAEMYDIKKIEDDE
ncbi:hypothetical protein [Oceanobacter antarcticus]|uniref:Phage protein n=1 Tax=Oceanobacter antarcticus TaxID=3133425 RepID=A0ABW8NER3_9GAMM